MLDREACERRVYRLATLLTGNPGAAWRVIGSVVDAQPDLRQLDGAHLDRLTVLRSREIRPGTLAGAGVSADVAAALASLSAQQREAWMFSRVYRLPLREASKSMDCSTTATERHLAAADRVMKHAMGRDAAGAAQAILDYSMTLDVPAIYHATKRRRRLRRWMAVIAIVVLLAVVVLIAWRLWLDHTKPQPAPVGEQPVSSLPRGVERSS